jgi:hypothetical protein
MPNYSESKIYAIKSFETDNIYIGSTIKRLPQRLATLKNSYKKYLASDDKKKYEDAFEMLKYNDAYIQLLELYNAKNKDDLNAKTFEYVERYKDKAINVKSKSKKVYESDSSTNSSAKEEITNLDSDELKSVNKLIESFNKHLENHNAGSLPACYSLPN